MKKFRYKREVECTHCEVVAGRIVRCRRKALVTAVTDVLGSRHKIVAGACWDHYLRIEQQIRDHYLAKFRDVTGVRLGCVRLSHVNDYTQELAMAA